jgi:hypothetical protein
MKTGFLQQVAGKSWLPLAAAAGLSLVAGGAVQGEPRTSIRPYLEIQQVATADFDRGEVLTYTGVGGGVDASVATRRVQATISYNYQRRIGWNGRLNDHDVHTGVAAVHVDAVPGVLALDAGAMAARTHADLRRPVASARTIDSAETANVYSAYAGPTLSTHAGPVSVGASYRLGYVRVDDHGLSGLPPGTPRIDRTSSSTVHNATASVGMGPGELPFGWTVGGGWVREDQNRLDSKFDGKYVRADVVVPVSPTLAVTAGAGYETMSGSQQDFLRDSTGQPVLSANGNLIADPSRPRLRTVDLDGEMWDAGIIWRPSERTQLQARGGRRYGGTTFTASLEHKINSRSALSASIYDNVSSFGRVLVADLSGLPRKFEIPRNGFGGSGTCIFGTDPGTGACFNDALQSLTSFNFRNRGANLVYSASHGPVHFGLGASYANRRYLTPRGTGAFPLEGLTDQSFTLNGNYGRRLSRSSGWDADAYAAFYDSGVAGADGSFGAGLTGRYYRNVYGDHLQAQLSAGLYTTQAGDFDANYGSILVGLRYTF